MKTKLIIPIKETIIPVKEAAIESVTPTEPAEPKVLPAPSERDTISALA